MSAATANSDSESTDARVWCENCENGQAVAPMWFGAHQAQLCSDCLLWFGLHPDARRGMAEDLANEREA